MTILKSQSSPRGICRLSDDGRGGGEGGRAHDLSMDAGLLHDFQKLSSPNYQNLPLQPLL